MSRSSRRAKARAEARARAAQPRPAAASATPREIQRAMQCAYQFYEGVRLSRERTSIPYLATDTQRYQSNWTRMELLSIARHLYGNDGLTRGAINDLASYTVGTGFKPQAQTPDVDWNDAAEDYFEAWSSRADYARLNDFDFLQFIWQVGEGRDGDIGIVLTRADDGEPCVQTVRGHRIGNFGERAEKLVDGVRTNERGQLVSYRVSEPDGGWREIPAASFILYYEPQESDALRGITTLHHAINHVRDKKDIIGFEKTTAKSSSMRAAVLKSGTGTVDPAQWGSGRDDEDGEAVPKPTALTVEQAESGVIQVIQKDEELVPWEFNRPSPAFMGFLDFLIREIAVGLGLPFEFLWNPEKIGGATMRFIMQKAQRRFAKRQENFKKRVLRRIWGYVIGDAIARGKLPSNPEWTRVNWQAPAELSVDAGRDAAQDREDVKMGLMSEAEHYGMRGKDYRVNRDQIEREVDDLLTRAARVAKKHGISLEAALGLLRQSTPNGPVAAPPGKPDGKNNPNRGNEK
jgi:capsid protein